MTRNALLLGGLALLATPLLLALGSCSGGDDSGGGGGGAGGTCASVAVGDWFLDLQTDIGGLTVFSGTLAQSGCILSLAEDDFVISGTLGADAGGAAVWNATIVEAGAQVGSFSGTFSATSAGAPYDQLAGLSGSVFGDPITGGSGMYLGVPSGCTITEGNWNFVFDGVSLDGTLGQNLQLNNGALTQGGTTVSFLLTTGATGSLTGPVTADCGWTAVFDLTQPGDFDGDCTGTFDSPTSFNGTGSLTDNSDGVVFQGTWVGTKL